MSGSGDHDASTSTTETGSKSVKELREIAAKHYPLHFIKASMKDTYKRLEEETSRREKYPRLTKSDHKFPGLRKEVRMLYNSYHFQFKI